jgi:hypothetical protein
MIVTSGHISLQEGGFNEAQSRFHWYDDSPAIHFVVICTNGICTNGQSGVPATHYKQPDWCAYPDPYHHPDGDPDPYAYTDHGTNCDPDPYAYTDHGTNCDPDPYAYTDHGTNCDPTRGAL